MSIQDEKLEPEGDGTPSFKKRAEDCYDALNKIRGDRPFGSVNVTIDIVTLEGMMGLLSHRFEGVM